MDNREKIKLVAQNNRMYLAAYYHLKPRSLYPELELRLDNLQVLCEDCNMGKSNKFSTDWR